MKLLLPLFFIIFFGNNLPQQADSIPEPLEIRIDPSEGLKPVEFEEDKVRDYRNQKEFDYADAQEKDNWWTRFKKWLNAQYNRFLNWIFGEYEPNGFLAMLIAVIPFIIIVGLLIFIVWLFSRLDPGGRMLKQNSRNEVYLSAEEELVKNEDLDALLKNAVAAGDFRLAIRYYYLKELRRLDRLKYIEYQFQKTNKEYLLEIDKKQVKEKFAEITKIYEFIWYGSFKVSENDYRLAEKNFLRMENALNAESHE